MSRDLDARGRAALDPDSLGGVSQGRVSIGRASLSGITVGALILAGIVFVYGSLVHASFVRIDDPHYVSDNAMVARGLTLEGLGWAWTTFHASNWHPLTWWSHLVDVELFGMDAGAHHRTNVMWHALDTFLLWLAFARLTGRPGRAACVAALFALHPSQVESVAWISERKDVLSTFFFALTLLAYERHARRPGPARMALVTLCLACGLACKPMLVTTPFVLLVLDAWPLRRGVSWANVREKWPLFGLVAASCVLTYRAQHAWGSVASLDAWPLARRVAEAVIGYGTYLRRMVWPSDLAVHHPQHETLAVGACVLASLLLVGIVAVAWRERVRRPYLAFGTAWFLGTLVPVIGIVQVGSQATADRYTYVPSIGVFVALVWFVGDRLERARVPRLVPATCATLVLVPLAIAARAQARTWHDSATLFEHAVAVEPRSEIARQSLGDEWVARGRVAEGIAQLRLAVEIAPRYEVARNGLGVALQQSGARQEGLAELRRATELAPNFFEAWFNLGIACTEAEDVAGATHAFERAVALREWHYEARANLAYLLYASGRTDEARTHVRVAATLAPDTADDHRRLAAIAEVVGDTALARAEHEHVVRLDPADVESCERARALAEAAGDATRAAALRVELDRRRARAGTDRSR